MLLFSRLVQSWGKIFFASDLVCNLGFLHWLQWIRLGGNKLLGISRRGALLRRPMALCFACQVWWLLEAQLLGCLCWSPIQSAILQKSLGYCQSYSYFAEQVPWVSIGISDPKMASDGISVFAECRAALKRALRGEEPQPHSGSGLGHCCLLAWR